MAEDSLSKRKLFYPPVYPIARKKIKQRKDNRAKGELGVKSVSVSAGFLAGSPSLPQERVLCRMPPSTGTTRLWGLARTKRGDEDDALEALEALGVLAYGPLFVETRVVRGRKVASPTFCFPGYLFWKIDEEWKRIASVKHIQQVFVQNDFPVPIRDEEICKLRTREGKDGFVRLEPRANPYTIHPGERVRVATGPFEGHFGLYVGMDEKARERVLLNMFGRSTPVALAKGSIVRAQ